MTANEIKDYMNLVYRPVLSDTDAYMYDKFDKMNIDGIIRASDNNSIVGIFGNFTSALCYTTGDIDTPTINQIKAICDNPIFKECKIRMMPDMHPGKVGPIGLTIEMPLNNPIMPALIGNDIGCGILNATFRTKHKLTISDFKKLDVVIRENLVKADDKHSAILSSSFSKFNNKSTFGTLGGGNHFIEIDECPSEKYNEYHLLIHSGSRSVGNEIYEKYMREGHKLTPDVPYESTVIDGDLKKEYLKDVKLATEYAKKSREYMAYHILNTMGWKEIDTFDNPHNYIENLDILSLLALDGDEIAMSVVKNMHLILHKGSISAALNQYAVIPINMKDGTIFGIGKGNEDWNCSAPHGAGRIMKRSEVANNVTLNAYKKSMEGIYSPSIGRDTLDECPMAYRGVDAIKEAIKDTVEIAYIAKPVYNFKNGGNDK